MAKLSEADIQEIKRIYTETGSYAETARRTGRAASTVKKYATGEASAKSAKTTKKDDNLIYFESIRKNLLNENIEPVPIEQIQLPDNFKSWTILTDAEREAMSLNYISKESE